MSKYKYTNIDTITLEFAPGIDYEHAARTAARWALESTGYEVLFKFNDHVFKAAEYDYKAHQLNLKTPRELIEELEGIIFRKHR